MKAKAGILAVFALIAFLAGARSAEAQASCDTAVSGAQALHSKVMQARDRAYTMQTVPRSDSSLAMSCFDKSMGNTGKLGRMFSDSFPTLSQWTNILTNVTTNWATLAAADWMGIASTLLTTLPLILHMDNTISGTMENLMTDFGTSFLSGLLVGFLTPYLDMLTGWVGSFGGSIAGNLYGDLLNGLIASLFPPLTCNNMADLWRSGNPYSTIGRGRIMGPNGATIGPTFISYRNLVSQTYGAYGGNFQSELNHVNNTANATSLNTVMSNTTSGMHPSQTAAVNYFYKKTPAFGAQLVPQDFLTCINNMTAATCP